MKKNTIRRNVSPENGMLLGAIILSFLAMLCFAPLAAAQLADDPVQNIAVRPELLKDVGIDQNLNESIPLDVHFNDEYGKHVELRHYFGSKPVILSLVYYDCPMLCTQVLNGLERSLKNLSLDIGKDYTVVTVSIDPTDTPKLALIKQQLYTGLLGRPGAAQNWHFLTGEEPQIKRLANAVGFRYAFDSESKQYAHASAIMLLTPEGRISRYFYGITYPSRDLRLGLVDASEGKIGSPVDAILLFCYHYDPSTGKYGLIISRVMQIAGGLTLLILGGLIFILARREHYALPQGRA